MYISLRIKIYFPKTNYPYAYIYKYIISLLYNRKKEIVQIISQVYDTRVFE